MSAIQTSGVSNRLLGYGCPVAAAIVALIALYGPGAQDVGQYRTAYGVFAAGAILGASSFTLSARALLLSATATGLVPVGVMTMPTAGSLAWFAAALLFAAVVDTFHVADAAGTRLGSAPLAGVVAGLSIFGIVALAF